MGQNIYLHEGNAEEKLPEVIEYIKENVRKEARTKAFQDCTTYWAGEIQKIMKDNSPSGAKLSRIRTMFQIPYEEED